MYVCGITPDAATHLGHAFTYISFDVLVRLLKFSGYKVRYLQNVTDIDDDILVRSKNAGRTWKEFGDHWTKVFQANMKALNWIKPDPYVKATDSIPTIIKIVSDLISKGYAYEVNGTVYFEVEKFGKYGLLGRFGKKEMIELSRERGADPDDPDKHDPLDFIVWQKVKEGEPSWNSPFGDGRPGWHIECSSMVYDHLGKQIDIHGGGEDLIYPHYESEIAQSESFTGKSPFVKYWMHTAYVRFQGEKMSKSLGNLVMVSDLLKKYSPNAVRYSILSHHWRKPWEYKEKEMKTASLKFEKLEKLVEDNSVDSEPDSEFINYLNNDFDTPGALEFLVRTKPKSLNACLTLLGFAV